MKVQKSRFCESRPSFSKNHFFLAMLVERKRQQQQPFVSNGRAGIFFLKPPIHHWASKYISYFGNVFLRNKKGLWMLSWKVITCYRVVEGSDRPSNDINNRNRQYGGTAGWSGLESNTRWKRIYNYIVGFGPESTLYHSLF